MTIDQAAIDRGDFLPDDLENEELKAAPEAEEVAEEKEATAEATPAEEAKAEEPARDEKGRFAGIPKARFDEAVGKEREAREAAERRASELERQLAERTAEAQKNAQVEDLEAKVSEMETKHAQLLLDGEGEKAAELMRQIRHTERQIAKLELRQEAGQVTNQVLEAERFELAVAKLEADHPVLNPKSEEYDSELVEMILDKQARLVKVQGMSPSKAIEKATLDILGKIAPKTETKTEGLAAAVSDRKSDQVKKNLEAQSRQPASMKDVGLDSDKIGEKGLPNVTQMTLEEFEALPASTKARLRGDLV